jgi:hypothetical protein
MNLCRPACTFVAFVLLLVGCGDQRVTVKGKVTLDGNPVDSGSISFQPKDGNGPGTGGTIENGEYLLQGPSAAVPGPKVVTIIAVMKTGKRIPAGPPHPAGAMMDEVVTFPLPGTRNPPTFDADVAPGKANEFNFDLKSR